MHYNALNIETAAQQVWLYFICRTTRPWHYLWINASLTRYIVLSSNLIKGKECKSDFTVISDMGYEVCEMLIGEINLRIPFEDLT